VCLCHSSTLNKTILTTAASYSVCDCVFAPLLVLIKTAKSPYLELNFQLHLANQNDMNCIVNGALLFKHMPFLFSFSFKMRTVRFTRLHVPWSVLSREAELLKIRVPTKKVSLYKTF